MEMTKEEAFKDGDICYSNNGAVEMLFIYNSKRSSSIVNYYCLVYNSRLFLNDWCDTLGDIRFATKEECDTLFDAINKGGYKWNSEEKKLEKKRWRADYLESYYYIDELFEVNILGDEHDIIDNNFYNNGNYFKTEQDAQQYADKIKELLKNR